MCDAALPAEVLNDIRSSQEKAQKAIQYHATQGRILTNKVKDNEVSIWRHYLQVCYVT